MTFSLDIFTGPLGKIIFNSGLTGSGLPLALHLKVVPVEFENLTMAAGSAVNSRNSFWKIWARTPEFDRPNRAQQSKPEIEKEIFKDNIQ